MSMVGAREFPFCTWQNALMEFAESPIRFKSEPTKKKGPQLSAGVLVLNSIFVSRLLLAPPALLFGWLFRCGFLLWLSFSLGFGFSFRFFRRSFLCWPFRRWLGSRRSRRRSGRCLRLFFADDQLLFFGLHHFAAQFVVFLQP